jgi:hypothetical protein
MDLSSFMPDLGPLGILISWQSLVLAIGIATFTHGVKAGIDYKVGGAAKRKDKAWINKLLLPAIPIFAGALAAVFIPLHPDALMAYIKDNAITGGKAISIFVAYGVCLGQFSDYVWHRFSTVTQKKAPQKSLPVTEAPKELPAETPPADPPKSP